MGRDQKIEKLIKLKAEKKTLEAEIKDLEEQLLDEFVWTGTYQVEWAWITVQKRVRETWKLKDKDQEKVLIEQYPGCVKKKLDCNALGKVKPELVTRTISTYLAVNWIG